MLHSDPGLKLNGPVFSINLPVHRQINAEKEAGEMCK